MCLGIFISLRIFNFPDITADGSYTLGGVITAVGIMAGWPLPLVFSASVLAGMLAGTATGLIHTRLKINSLLSGILVMTALYSVNLNILGRSNLPLALDTENIFSYFTLFSTSTINNFFTLTLIVGVLAIFISWLLKTDFGLSMRAAGNNIKMARSFGINANFIKIIGLAIANGFIAISGFLIVQMQGFADINMGVGIVILGLGAVIIGETVSELAGFKKIFLRVCGVILGSIIFRLVLSFAISAGINPNWMKLLTALIVLLIIGIPSLIPSLSKKIKLE
ncbi:MAG: ABC transporter permease [Chitinophagaceae bacterium]|nr:MAG: ABC transporter permease [Chitinophagaceae bacterium]